MLMLFVFLVAASDDSATTFGDAATFVVVSSNVATAISTVVVAFNIFVTRAYICTRTVRTVRI